MSFKPETVGEKGAATPTEERSEAEVREIKRSAAYRVKLFAPYDMVVVPSADGGWKCSMSEGHAGMEAFNDYVTGKIDDIDSLPDELFQPDQIEYGEDSLGQYPRKVLDGLLRHEIGHARRSKYKSIAKGARHALTEKALPTTLIWGMNVCEDAWMEDCEREDSIAARQQLDATMEHFLPLHLGLIKQGQVPRLTQLGLRVLLENAKSRGIVTQSQIDEWNVSLAPEVKRAFERIQPHAEKYFDPSQTADENYKLYIEHIWPVFKLFEDRSVQEEMLNRMLNPKNESDKRLRDQFSKQIRRALEREIDKQEDSRKQKRKEFEKSDSNAPKSRLEGMKRWVRKNVLRQSDEGSPEKGQADGPAGHIQKLTRDRVSKALERGKGRVNTSNTPPDLARLMLDELKRLEKEDPRLFEKVKQTAQREIDKAQAEGLRENLPVGMDMEEDKDGIRKPKMKPGNPKEVKKKRDELKEFSKQDDADQFNEREDIMKKIEEAKTLEDLEKLEKEEKFPLNHEDELKDALEQKKEALQDEEERRKREMERLGFNPEERELYEEYTAIEREVERDLQFYERELAKILPKKSQITHDGAYYHGPRIKDRPGMVQRIVTGRGDLYQRPVVHEVPKPKIFLLLLIDRSGSMQGQPMRESLKTSILFNELSNIFDIPVSIIFYDDKVEEVKTLQQDFNAPELKLKAKFMRASKQSGSTNIGLAIDHSKTELAALKRRYQDMGGIMLAMTDGIPTAGEEPGQTKVNIDETNAKFPIIALYLAGREITADEAKPVEELFGSQESGRTVVVSNLSELRHRAFLSFKRAALFLMRRYA